MALAQARSSRFILLGSGRGSKTTVSLCLGAKLRELLCERPSSEDTATEEDGEKQKEGRV